LASLVIRDESEASVTSSRYAKLNFWTSLTVEYPPKEQKEKDQFYVVFMSFKFCHWFLYDILKYQTGALEEQEQEIWI
jgi:hypothetical protein